MRVGNSTQRYAAAANYDALTGPQQLQLHAITTKAGPTTSCPSCVLLSLAVPSTSIASQRVSHCSAVRPASSCHATCQSQRLVSTLPRYVPALPQPCSPASSTAATTRPNSKRINICINFCERIRQPRPTFCQHSMMSGLPAGGYEVMRRVPDAVSLHQVLPAMCQHTCCIAPV